LTVRRPEWREAHPIQEPDLYGEFQPEDVLRNGLPPLPATGIEPGTYFPIAAWQNDRDAAVLYIHRLISEEFDLPGDEYEDETEHLVVDANGEWISVDSGAGNWVNVFDPPRELSRSMWFSGQASAGAATETRRSRSPAGSAAARWPRSRQSMPLGPGRIQLTLGDR
jgi:hypothetical protein